MSERIRVLRIIGECKSGGTESIALNYYKELNHDKVAMDFLFYGESLQRFTNELNKYGDKVINVPLYSKHMLKSILSIRKTVISGKYDIVHSQLNALNFFPLLGAFLGGAKIRIAANHSTSNLKYETIKSILKFILRPSSGILATNYAACSEHAGKWCFGNRKKIKVIRNAIDLHKFKYEEETRNRIRTSQGWAERFVIGHAGRFIKQKNHDFIVEIFSEIYRKNNKALLVLIGDGELLESIKLKVEKLGLSKAVIFMGVRFDINELMQGMDVFLFPSLYEGLGNVVTESQAVGLKVVASDVVPQEVKMTEYVEFLSLKESTSVWANKVLEYANGYKRNDTHELLIRNGYEIHSAARDLENYYTSLVDEK